MCRRLILPDGGGIEFKCEANPSIWQRQVNVQSFNRTSQTLTANTNQNIRAVVCPCVHEKQKVQQYLNSEKA